MTKHLTLLLFIGLAFGSDSERIISKWDNGVTKRIQYYTGSGFDEVIIGIKTFYPNGDLRWRCSYQNNERHGEYSFYLEGNNLLLKGEYFNGEINGIWYAYHPEEMKATLHGVFSNDKYGAIVRFHDNGELQEYKAIVTESYNIKKYEYLYCNIYYWYNNGILSGKTERVYDIDGDRTWRIQSYYEDGTRKMVWKQMLDGETTEEYHYYPNGDVRSISKAGVTMRYKPDGTLDYMKNENRND